MAWRRKNEEGGAGSEMDRFDPSQGQNQEKGSTTKRVALFIFMAAGALFTLVTFTILNSDEAIRSSSAPQEVIEASRGASIVIPPPPKEAERPEQPAPVVTPQPQQPSATAPAREAIPTPVQPEPAEQETPQVRRSVRPAYLPASGVNRARNVTDSRRQTQAQRMQAASAPTAIQGFGRQEPQPGTQAGLQAGEGTFPTTPAAIGAEMAGGAMGAAQSNVSGLMPDMMDGTSDPNGWGRKEAFRQQALPAEYSQHTRAFPVSALELKAGALLPCVLISGLNSDLPGNLIAQVSENVWDTSTGRFLLIPRGSRLIGTYDNQITYGQNRALVIWSRLIFPDGSSLLLDNLQGTDQSGYTGFKGRVDRHWGQLLTSALLVSLVGAGVELAEPNNRSNNNNNNNSKNVGSILSERVATSIAEVMTQILSKNLSRQPTIVVKPGYRFMIFVQHDIVFPRVWNASRGR